MDYRTEGSRGVDERDGAEESGAANISGPIAPALDDAPMGHIPEKVDAEHPGLEEEKGFKAGSTRKNRLELNICTCKQPVYYQPKNS